MAQLYPDEIIQEVSTSNDIVDIVSEYVSLKRRGNNLMGLCPFHSEKTPSFSVSPDKQLFHCFGCGAGGTIIQFVMRIDNLDFIETVKMLAERAGIKLPEDKATQGDEAERHRQKQNIYAMNIEAARFFYQVLCSQEGEKAREYLKSRQINQDTIVHFGLGFAPDSWHRLKEHLILKGYNEQDIQKAGLISKSDKGYYDKFRNRIMFPIFDVRGNVIGFGGRVMGDMMPKYLNSPETLVFNKSNNLYGLNFAKNKKTETIIIVEGYMDVISLHQNGIINTVASLGTALTKKQAMLIKRYCKEVIIAYDMDVAGQAATLRGIEQLADLECKVKVLVLKEGKDPDEFIKNKGVERFNFLLEQALSLIEYKLMLLKQKYDIHDVDQKIAFVTEMANVFSKVDNAVERDVYIKKIADETDISVEAIVAEMRKKTYYNQKQAHKRMNKKVVKNYHTQDVTKNIRQQTSTSQQNDIRQKYSKLFPVNDKQLQDAEKMLLNLLCANKSIYHKVKNSITIKDFSEGIHQKLAKIIYELRDTGQIIDPIKILSKFNGNEIEAVTAILQMETNIEDYDKAIKELIDIIYRTKNFMENVILSLQEGNVEKLNTLVMAYKR